MSVLDICNVIGQGVPHGRFGDTKASWLEAMCPGSRFGEVFSSLLMLTYLLTSLFILNYLLTYFEQYSL